MKKIILVAALATVTACNQADTTAEPAATEEAAPAVATTAADGGPSTGTFEITLPDGTKFTDEVKEDGTYEATAADGSVMDTGKWEQKSPAEYCQTSDKEGSVQKCYAEKVEDGVYTSTDPDTGEVSTVVRVEAAE